MADYIELEYIESTGTQYIDLNYMTTSHFGFEIDVSISSNTGANLFGAGNGNNQYPYFNLRENLCRYSYGNGDYNQMITFCSTDYNSRHKFSFKYNTSSSNYSYYYDDTKVNDLALSVHPTNANLALFSFRDNNGSIRNTSEEVSRCKFYNLKLYESDVLTMDIIPVKRKSDNEVCLYDKVSKTYFTNQGTGTFIAGPILDIGYIELEYIESNGTQYLTLVSGTINNNYGLKLKYSVQQTLDNYVAGSSGLNNNRFLFLSPTNWGSSSSSDHRWRYGWGSSDTSSASPAYLISSYPDGLENVYECSLNFKNDKKICFADNTAITISSSSQSFTNTNLYLFKSYDTPVTARIYSAQLSNNNDIILDLIPVKRKADDVICMYDKISKTYFLNQGTGNFIAGPKISDHTLNEKITSISNQIQNLIDLTTDILDYKPYKELEYIYSSGAKINTGIYPNQTTIIELEFIVTRHNGYSTIYKAESSGQFYLMSRNGSSTCNFQLGNGTNFDASFYPNTKYKVKAGAGSVYINDSLYRDYSTGNFLLTQAIHLFVSNGNTAYGNIYACKIWNNGSLVRDLIPVKRKEDNKVGMYDKVSKEFYFSTNSSNFTAGPEIQ